MTRAVARPSSDEAGSPQTASPSSVVISWFRLTSRSSAMRASLRVERRRHPQQQTAAVAGFPLALRSLSPGAALDGVAHRPPSVSLPHVHGSHSSSRRRRAGRAADHRRDPRRKNSPALTFSRISDETMDAAFLFVYDDGGDAATVEAATDRAQERLVGRSEQCSCPCRAGDGSGGRRGAAARSPRAGDGSAPERRGDRRRGHRSRSGAGGGASRSAAAASAATAARARIPACRAG